MFSGIIEELAKVSFQDSKPDGGSRLVVESAILSPESSIGDSIAVNGVCLTVTSVEKEKLSFDISPETLRVTNLNQLGSGDVANLELSLQIGDRLGGHFVSGHIDDVGEILDRRSEGDCSVFKIAANKDILNLLIDRGSISVDGISLTVTKIFEDAFELVIIPHTAKLTTLGTKSVGDKVNLESDMIGKYISRLMTTSNIEGREKIDI